MIDLNGGTDGLRARVDPAHGASVASLRTPDGRELLWHVTEDLRSGFTAVPSGSPELSSQVEWMTRSVGGWEVMAPNAGEGGCVDGVGYEFHGTAGRLPWSATAVGVQEARLEVSLPTYSLVARRRVCVDGRRCQVTETLLNEARSPLAVAWGSHLAFGRDMLDGALQLDLHGEVLGGTVDGVAAPVASIERALRQPRTGASALAYMRADRAQGLAVLHNTTLGLRATVQWDPLAFPYLWIWIELGGTRGWPFFGGARALGLEPVSSWPAVGVPRLRDETNTELLLEPDVEIRGEVEVTVDAA